MSKTALLLSSLTFAAALTGQRPGGALVPFLPPPPPPPAPTHALPLIPPPVQHPAYLGQPGMMDDGGSAAAAAGSGGAAPSAGTDDPAAASAHEFLNRRVGGRDLKSAVDRVLKGLDWKHDLLDARAAAVARGVPILWIQSLGDIGGFA